MATTLLRWNGDYGGWVTVRRCGCSLAGQCDYHPAPAHIPDAVTVKRRYVFRGSHLAGAPLTPAPEAASKQTVGANGGFGSGIPDPGPRYVECISPTRMVCIYSQGAAV